MQYSFKNYLLDTLHGKIEYCTDGKGSLHAAIEKGKSSSLSLSLPRYLGAESVMITLVSDDNTVSKSIYGEWDFFDDGYDNYTFDFSPLDLDIGLYFYDIRVSSPIGDIFCIKSCEGVAFSETKPDNNQFQLTVSDFPSNATFKHFGGIIYHIFVDRFMKGGEVSRDSNDIIVDDWSDGVPEYPEYPGAPMKNNTFYGGTLWGIADRLDYLSSLGVSLIYLSPIFKSPSNHKYDTADYMSVDQGFGGDEALIHLIREAKRYDIGIILDGVFNHTGADSIYFNKYRKYGDVGAYQTPTSPYCSWYEFKSYPDEYTSWWGIEILPRINPDVKECREFFLGDGGVIDKYSSLGISGFRLDVADELSDSFIEGIRSLMAKNDPSSILYGEVWEDASNKIAYGKRKRYYLGRELDGVMNYPLRSGIIDFLRHKSHEKLKYALGEVMYNAPRRISNLQMNLIGTHDTERILTALGGEDKTGYTNDDLRTKRMTEEEYKCAASLLKQAYTILATLPGIPSIYYGDEVGLEGYSDPFNRMPYPIGKEDMDILDHYRSTGRIRKDNTVYQCGDFTLHELSDDLLIFSRSNEKERLLTVINNSLKDITLSFRTAVYMNYSRVNIKEDSIISIPKYGFEIISTRLDTEITLY